MLLNQRIAKVKSKNNDLLPFIYFVLRLPAMKTEMENISKGTAQQNLSPIETLKLQLNFDESTAVDLSHTLSSMFNQIVHNMIQNRNLSEIRDALLPKLMNGEIDVSKVDVSDPSCLDKSLFIVILYFFIEILVISMIHFIQNESIIMARGIIYILTNDAMPGFIKIGRTDKTVEQRMKQLDKTCAPYLSDVILL